MRVNHAGLKGWRARTVAVRQRPIFGRMPLHGSPACHARTSAAIRATMTRPSYVSFFIQPNPAAVVVFGVYSQPTQPL